MYFLTWRDVKVRYKQTAIGILWAVLQPVAMMLVFTFIFGRLAKMPSSGVPFSLFSLSGLLPWQLFSRAITESTNSLVTDQRLISRVYFPRIIVPIASVMAALVDFLIAATILFLLLVGYGLPLRVELIWMPVFMLLLILAALGVGFWLSALNVEYRDVTYTLPFLNHARRISCLTSARSVALRICVESYCRCCRGFPLGTVRDRCCARLDACRLCCCFDSPVLYRIDVVSAQGKVVC